MITIIVPIYNAEKYLVNCINSVINQTYKEWKLILINDGSTDNSLNICTDFSAKDQRIKVYSQVNKGQAAARNYGISKVQTPYVTFLDADDEISLDTLKENIKILLSNPEIECLQYPYYRAYNSPKQEIVSYKNELIVSDFYKKWLSNKKISWMVWDKIFKVELFDKVTFKEGIVYEDNLFVADLLSVVKNIYLSDKGLYYYYHRLDSTTTSKLSQKRELDSFYVTCEIAKILEVRNEKHLLLDFIVRLYNIKKSLKSVFGVKEEIPYELFNSIHVLDIIKYDDTIVNRIKLLLAKYAN